MTKKIHYVTKKGRRNSRDVMACGNVYPSMPTRLANYTNNKEKVTCSDCLEELDMSEKKTVHIIKNWSPPEPIQLYCGNKFKDVRERKGRHTHIRINERTKEYLKKPETCKKCIREYKRFKNENMMKAKEAVERGMDYLTPLEGNHQGKKFRPLLKSRAGILVTAEMESLKGNGMFACTILENDTLVEAKKEEVKEFLEDIESMINEYGKTKKVENNKRKCGMVDKAEVEREKAQGIKEEILMAVKTKLKEDDE